MKLNDYLKQQKLHVLKNRARGIPLLLVSEARQEMERLHTLNDRLLNQITLVAGQRDEAIRVYNALVRDLQQKEDHG